MHYFDNLVPSSNFTWNFILLSLLIKIPNYSSRSKYGSLKYEVPTKQFQEYSPWFYEVKIFYQNNNKPKG